MLCELSNTASEQTENQNEDNRGENMTRRNTGTIDLGVYLEDLRRQRSILISDMDDATDAGNKSKRMFILNKVIDCDHEIQDIENQIKLKNPAIRSVVFYGKDIKCDVSNMTEDYVKMLVLYDGYIEYK